MKNLIFFVRVAQIPNEKPDFPSCFGFLFSGAGLGMVSILPKREKKLTSDNNSIRSNKDWCLSPFLRSISYERTNSKVEKIQFNL